MDYEYDLDIKTDEKFITDVLKYFHSETKRKNAKKMLCLTHIDEDDYYVKNQVSILYKLDDDFKTKLDDNRNVLDTSLFSGGGTYIGHYLKLYNKYKNKYLLLSNLQKYKK